MLSARMTCLSLIKFPVAYHKAQYLVPFCSHSILFHSVHSFHHCHSITTCTPMTLNCSYPFNHICSMKTSLSSNLLLVILLTGWLLTFSVSIAPRLNFSYWVFNLSWTKFTAQRSLSVVAHPFLLRLLLVTLVSSLILTSPFLIRSLLSLVHVFTISLIFAASDLFLTSVRLTLLAHHLYTQSLITATHCTIAFLKPS